MNEQPPVGYQHLVRLGPSRIPGTHRTRCGQTIGIRPPDETRGLPICPDCSPHRLAPPRR